MYGAPGRSSTSNNGSLCAPGFFSIWSAYLAQIELGDDKPWLNLTHSLIGFFSTTLGQVLLSQLNDDDGVSVLSIDFEKFQKICVVEDLYVALEEKPKITLLCMSVAAHQVLLTQWDNNRVEDGIKVNIRLHNYPESMIALKNLKAAYIDKLVSVRGTVVKVSTVKPLVVQMGFDCVKCKTSITRMFPDGKFSPPSKCDLDGCKSRNFNPIRPTAQTIDFQKIRIQELLKPEDHEDGRVPRTVECELLEDLVDACIP